VVLESSGARDPATDAPRVCAGPPLAGTLASRLTDKAFDQKSAAYSSRVEA